MFAWFAFTINLINSEASLFIFRITISIAMIKISHIFVHISTCVHTDEPFLKYSRCTRICKCSAVTMLSQVKKTAHRKTVPRTLQQYHQFKSVTKQRNGAANWRTRDRVPGNSCSCKSALVKAASFPFPGKRGPRIHITTCLWFVSRVEEKYWV